MQVIWLSWKQFCIYDDICIYRFLTKFRQKLKIGKNWRLDKIEDWTKMDFAFSGVINSVDFISLSKKYIFWKKNSKIEKNRNFCPKSTFWSKHDFFDQNRNFGQKSKLWKNFQISMQKKIFLWKKTFLAKISQK